MTNNRRPIIVAMLLMLMVGTGVAFQNCAQPLDPSLLEQSSTQRNPDTNPNSSQNPNQLDVTFTMFPNPATEGSVVGIYPDINTDSKEQHIYEYRLNGQTVGRDPTLSTRLKKTDVLTFTITIGSTVKEYTVPVIVEAADNNPADDNNPIDTSVKGKLYIKGASGSPELKPQYLNHAEERTFIVQLDYAKMGNGAAMENSIRFRWETYSLNQVTPTLRAPWALTNGDRTSISTKADYKEIVRYYRVQAYDLLDESRKSDWSYFSVVTKNYKQSTQRVTTGNRVSSDMNGWICATPYVMTGIYLKQGLNNFSGIRCSLPMKASKTSWFGTGALTNYYAYKSGHKYCNDVQAASDQLVIGIPKTYKEVYTTLSTRFYFQCAKVSGAAYDRRGEVKMLYPTDAQEKFYSCPTDQYVMGLKRDYYNSQYNKRRLLNTLICGRLSP